MLVACLGGLTVGLFVGFLRIMFPFLFLLAGVGLAGMVSEGTALALPEFLGAEYSRMAIVFLVVFAALQAIGAMVSALMSLVMTAASTAVSAAPTGALLNRIGGAAAGLIYGCVFLSVILIALQQIPVDYIASAMEESSFAHGLIGWVDEYSHSIEISREWRR